MKNSILELADGRQVNYQVRLSNNHNVKFRIDHINGFVVIVPRGFDLSTIEEFVSYRKDWVETQLQRIDISENGIASILPEFIELSALSEVWQVEYRKTKARKTNAEIDASDRIVVTGQVDNVAACLAAMHRWLASRGHEILVPWLERLSSETGLKHYGVTIRGQLTRLGSCTESNSINLNYKLLFLPHEWVRYILIHELCHTVEKNHTERFWTLVQRFEPKAKEFAAAVRCSGEYLPEWVSYPAPL